MADPLSGVAIIICIAFGILTIVLLFIFANRQIKRFSLKSKYCPHTPIAHDAPKSLQNEINRRLDVIKSITYQPPLLKKSDEIYFEDEYSGHMPCHLYRMKALDSLPTLDAAILSADSSKIRPYHQDYRVYLIRLAQSGLFGQIEMTTIHKFADLYEAARHEPGEFDKEQYIQFINLMTQIEESISTRSGSQQQQQQPVNNVATSTVSLPQPSEPVRNAVNVRTSTVSSSLESESSEEGKETYETSSVPQPSEQPVRHCINVRTSTVSSSVKSESSGEDKETYETSV